jgi:hypothetical protein
VPSYKSLEEVFNLVRQNDRGAGLQPWSSIYVALVARQCSAGPQGVEPQCRSKQTGTVEVPHASILVANKLRGGANADAQKVSSVGLLCGSMGFVAYCADHALHLGSAAS